MTDAADDQGLHVLNVAQVAPWLKVIKCIPVF